MVGLNPPRQHCCPADAGCLARGRGLLPPRAMNFSPAAARLGSPAHHLLNQGSSARACWVNGSLGNCRPLLTLWRRNLGRSDRQQGSAVCSSTAGRFYREEVLGIFCSSSRRCCLLLLDLCRRGFTLPPAVNEEGVNQNGSRGSTPIFKLQSWHCPALPSQLLRALTLKSMSANAWREGGEAADHSGVDCGRGLSLSRRNRSQCFTLSASPPSSLHFPASPLPPSSTIRLQL